MTDKEKIDYLENQINDIKRNYHAAKQELSEFKIISERRKNKIDNYRKTIYDLNEAIRTIKGLAKNIQPKDIQPVK